jgi:hypothetical protein
LSEKSFLKDCDERKQCEANDLDSPPFLTLKGKDFIVNEAFTNNFVDTGSDVDEEIAKEAELEFG